MFWNTPEQFHPYLGTVSSVTAVCQAQWGDSASMTRLQPVTQATCDGCLRRRGEQLMPVASAPMIPAGALGQRP